MFDEFKNLVYSEAWRAAKRYHQDVGDCISEAWLALKQAEKAYDETRAQFSTLFVHTVRNHFKNVFIRQNQPAIVDDIVAICHHNTPHQQAVLNEQLKLVECMLPEYIRSKFVALMKGGDHHTYNMSPLEWGAVQHATRLVLAKE